ncbi:tRNA 2-thiocytidine biosynthesis TtcA family protein [Phosphitispora fastidiosa]|uniref:tRNA 2-thiocytidine biosynthesis TtcA family protein n=1 Tax=Phosphitispora fastidiosa TaxID=2837202 RepID=UPI001E2CCD92|nr:ATP-binding protein [Phosphitispora fastidiosa]MBU7008126.1 tRNA(Ile)-lysidine synthase TilS/MesJ [Phosphitispora fastidiosa]
MKRIYRRELWQRIGKANEDFGLIGAGDHIAIGLSGGKDSTALLYIMTEWQKFCPVSFKITAITLDMGWGGDLTPLKNYCAATGVLYHVEQTNIGPIVFETRQESNPCSLCARLRRGTLHNIAKSLGCNKVALGHHLDDALETLLLCMSFESRFKTFKPKTYLDRADITLIRPMIYVEEKTIIKLVKRLSLPVIHNPCPANGLTKRQEMKDIISCWEKISPSVRDNLLGALKNSNLWPR